MFMFHPCLKGGIVSNVTLMICHVEIERATPSVDRNWYCYVILQNKVFCCYEPAKGVVVLFDINYNYVG